MVSENSQWLSLYLSSVCFSTIITIAHRLNTVLDYDRILVLKDGNVAEMDSPKQLMQTEGSIFRGMCQVGLMSDYDDETFINYV